MLESFHSTFGCFGLSGACAALVVVCVSSALGYVWSGQLLFFDGIISAFHFFLAVYMSVLFNIVITLLVVSDIALSEVCVVGV